MLVFDVTAIKIIYFFIKKYISHGIHHNLILDIYLRQPRQFRVLMEYVKPQNFCL